MKLEGRTALVTGGSRGIGRAIATALAQEGADVAINFQSNEVAAAEVVEEIQHMGRKAVLARADVSDPAEASRMAEAVLKDLHRVVPVRYTTWGATASAPTSSWPGRSSASWAGPSRC